MTSDEHGSTFALRLPNFVATGAPVDPRALVS